MSPGPASLPKFWEHEAGLNFSAVANIFRVTEIIDNEIKSDSQLSALDVRHFPKLRHVLPNLLPKHSYQQMKTALLQHYAPSEDENLKCLLHQTRVTSDYPCFSITLLCLNAVPKLICILLRICVCKFNRLIIVPDHFRCNSQIITYRRILLNWFKATLRHVSRHTFFPH